MCVDGRFVFMSWNVYIGFMVSEYCWGSPYGLDSSVRDAYHPVTIGGSYASATVEP